MRYSQYTYNYGIYQGALLTVEISAASRTTSAATAKIENLWVNQVVAPATWKTIRRQTR